MREDLCLITLFFVLTTMNKFLMCIIIWYITIVNCLMWQMLQWINNKFLNNQVNFINCLLGMTHSSSIRIEQSLTSVTEEKVSSNSVPDLEMIEFNSKMSMFERLGTNLENPFNSMISDTASCFLFIAILLMVLVNPQDQEGKTRIS